MRSTYLAVLIGASLTSAAACATKSQTGAAGGAVAGGLVGHAIGGDTGMLIGAIVGGAVGYEVGRQIEEEDRRRIAYALELEREMEWRNAHTGYAYRVEPTGTRYLGDGRECREFRLLAEIDGRPEEMTGTACRRPDGTWETISG
jgi:surface antigen